MSIVKFIKNTPKVAFGKGIFSQFRDNIFDSNMNKNEGVIIFLVDSFFNGSTYITEQIKPKSKDHIVYVSTENEPSTDRIDLIVDQIKTLYNPLNRSCIVGIGGGCTLDTAKAVSNLLTNSGKAADYQGWDLLKNSGIYNKRSVIKIEV